MTSDRIQKTQKNIRTQLPARDEYVINTSEYEEMRARMIGILNTHKALVQTDKKPTLLRTGEHYSGTSTEP